MQHRVGAPTATPAASSGGTTSQSSSPMVQFVRGMPLAEQLETLAPRENAKAPGGGPPVQLKIDVGTLNSKLESTPEYSGTIDSDTDCKTANDVGEAWVGGGASRQKYGPPFNYQLLSADGKRQYRPPMMKQSGQQAGNAQANYEARSGSGGRFGFNAHVTVTDIADHMPK